MLCDALFPLIISLHLNVKFSLSPFFEENYLCLPQLLPVYAYILFPSSFTFGSFSWKRPWTSSRVLSGTIRKNPCLMSTQLKKKCLQVKPYTCVQISSYFMPHHLRIYISFAYLQYVWSISCLVIIVHCSGETVSIIRFMSMLA